MIKKTILALLLMNSLLFSRDINIQMFPTYANGAITISIDSVSTANNDWIAVYAKGASTDWNNVLHWSWVKDLPTSRGNRFFLYDGALTREQEGDYVVRHFQNNSYQVYKSFDFTIKSIASHVQSLTYDPNFEHDMRIMIGGFTRNQTMPEPKDWIAIYKKEDNNDWGNVVQWIWAKDSYLSPNIGREDIRIMFLDDKNYETGVQYEARYFLNNSFTTHIKSAPFFARDVPIVSVKLKLPRGLNSTVTVKRNFIKTSTDWVGIFKQLHPTTRANLIAWTYLDKNNLRKKLKILKPNHINSNDTYKAVFFKENSYTKVGQKHYFKGL